MSVLLKKPIEEFNGVELAAIMRPIGANARAAARILAALSASEKKHAITAMARTIRAAAPTILAANREDVAEAEKAEQGAAAEALSDALLDAVCLIGPIARCRERLATYWAAGLDLPILYPPIGVDGARAVINAFRQ